MGLLDPPRLRASEGKDRHATWLELFFDLVFVVAIAEVGTVLLRDVTWTGVARFSLLFVSVWWAWVDATLYADRFDTDDLGYRLVTLLEMLTVAALAASVHGAFGSTGKAFSLAYVVVRGVLILRHWRAWRHIDIARPLMGRMMLSTSSGAAFWLVAAFVGSSLRPWLWLTGVLVTFVIAHLPSTRRLYTTVPLSASHLPERFGLLTIIVLGEGVTAVVAGLAERDWQAASTFTAAFGVVTTFAIWWVYFENTNKTLLAQIETVAERSWLRPAWLYSHLALLMSLTAFGVAVELAILTGLRHASGTAERVLLIGSMVVALGALTAIAIVPGSRRHMVLQTRTLLVAVAAVLLAGAATFPFSPVFATGTIALVAVALVIVDLASHRDAGLS